MPAPAARQEGSEAERTAPRPVLVVTPYSLKTNPYILRLTESMRATGLRVELARGRSPILLWRALRSHGVPRVVHLQWHHPYLTAERLPEAVLRALLFFLQWATLRVLGARFVWTVHNLVEHERRHVRWELFACRLLGRVVDAPIAHCSEAARRVADAYRLDPARVRVVPHGMLELDGVFDREMERRAMGLTASDVLLLNFGRVRRYKGIEDLLAALRRVDSPRLHLVVAGFPDDPELADALVRETSADPRVRLRLELVSDPDLGRLLAAADAVVLPYRDSLTSGAGVLAAAHGRPVVGPRVGCLGDFPEGAALLYDPEVEGALATALLEAQEAPLGAMGEAARAHVARYPWERVAEQTVAVYEQVAGSLRADPRGL